MAAAMIVTAGTAHADVHNLGNPGLLGGGQSAVFNFTDSVPVVDSISISFDYAEPVLDASWASDVQVILTDGVGNSLIIGGFINSNAADILWAFDGSISDDPGNYSDTFATNFVTDGIWSLTFVNDWTSDPNPNDYANLIVTMGPVPAPGALALLGLAGVSRRRRRKA